MRGGAGGGRAGAGEVRYNEENCTIPSIRDERTVKPIWQEMHELERYQFKRVGELFSGIQLYPPLPVCVIEGRQPGRIFADDEASPSAALVCQHSGYSYLGGKRDAFASWIEERLFTAIDREAIDLCTTAGFWEARLPILPGLRATPYQMRSYRLSEDRFQEARSVLPAPPQGCRIVRITADLLARHPGNPCLCFLESEQSFVQDGLGFVLLDGDELASSCITSFVGNGTCDVSLATREEYRRRGHATQVTAAFIQGCTDIGIQPVWHTTADNAASDAIAARFGFELLGSFTMYRVRR